MAGNSGGILGRLKVIFSLDNTKYKERLADTKKSTKEAVNEIKGEFDKIKSPTIDLTSLRLSEMEIKRYGTNLKKAIESSATAIAPSIDIPPLEVPNVSPYEQAMEVVKNINDKVGVSIRQLRDAQTVLKKELEQPTTNSSQYTKLSNDLAVVSKELTNAGRAQRQLASEVNVPANSIEGQRRLVARLKQEWLLLDRETDKVRFDALEKEINSTTQALLKSEAAIGVYSRNVGNYRSGFDGLGMSIAQLTREAPAFAVSMNTGFLALSNNIPTLTDEIQRLTIRNRELNKEGIKTPSVMSSIFKSFFGWQTLISVGVTLLTLYGGKLFEWVGSLFDGKKALDDLSKSQKALNELNVKAASDAQSDITRLNILRKTAEDTAESTDTRAKAMDELRRLYPQYLANLTDDAIKSGNVADAYDKITKSLLDRAKAQAYMNKLTENESRLLEIETELTKRAEERNRELGDSNKIIEEQRKLFEQINSGNLGVEELKEAKKQQRENVSILLALANSRRDDNKLIKEQNTLIAENKRLVEGLPTDGLFGDSASTQTINYEIGSQAQLEAEIAKIEKLIKETITTTDEGAAAYARYTKQIDELRVALSKLPQNIDIGVDLDLGNNLTSQLDSMVTAIDDTTPNLESALENMREVVAVKSKEIYDALQPKTVELDISPIINQATSDISSGLGSVIGKIASGETLEDPLNEIIITPLANAMTSMGSMMVSMGIAALNLKKLALNPALTIAAGTTLMILGAAASSMAQSSVDSGLSGSSSSSGNTYTGGYSDTGVYTPTTTTKVEVSGTLRADGKDMAAVLKKQDTYNKR